MRAVLFLTVLALAGWFPALNDPNVKREPVEAPWTHGFSVEARGVFVAASSGPIEAVEGPNCQFRDTLAAGPRSAVSCDAPGRYRLQTRGTVSAGVVLR